MKKIFLLLPLVFALTGCCGIVHDGVQPTKKAKAPEAKTKATAKTTKADTRAAIEKSVADKLAGVAETQRTADGLKINLKGDVLFATGSSTLEGKSSDVVNSLGSILSKQDVAKVHVTGYTDDRGDEAMNQQLSLDRAVAVKNRLKDKGVKGTITTEGKGESNPVASNDTAAGRAQNRRVEILVKD